MGLLGMTALILSCQSCLQRSPRCVNGAQDDEEYEVGLVWVCHAVEWRVCHDNLISRDMVAWQSHIDVCPAAQVLEHQK